MSDGRKPVLKLGAGAIEIAVWANEHEGKTFHSATIQRSYKDTAGQWQRTASFPTRDLPALAELLRVVYQEIEIKERGKTPATGGAVSPPDDNPF